MSINRNSWLFDQIVGPRNLHPDDDNNMIMADDILDCFGFRYRVNLDEITGEKLVQMFTYAEVDVDDGISRTIFSKMLDKPRGDLWKKLQYFADKYETPLVKAMNDGESGKEEVKRLTEAAELRAEIRFLFEPHRAATGGRRRKRRKTRRRTRKKQKRKKRCKTHKRRRRRKKKRSYRKH